MSELVMERIEENLTRLRLSRVQQRVRELVQEAQNNQDSYLGFLDRLLQEEVTAKEERRVTMSLRIAGLPFAKTIEEYDFAFHDSLDKRQVMSLFDLDCIGRKENVIFLSLVRSHKTGFRFEGLPWSSWLLHPPCVRVSRMGQ
jgi:DNA replication protein DnaC